MNEKLNIAFVGLYEEKNFGDPIIAKCTEFLFLSQINDAVNVSRLNLDPARIHTSFIFKIKKKLVQIIHLKKLYKYIENERLKEIKSFYQQKLKNIDIIIFVGGGLIKFSTQYFGDSIFAIVMIAQERGIPVLFNSVGIEGYDSNNEKCQNLRKLLNMPIVKYISTRDDLKTLNECYLTRKDLKAVLVADPAVWAADCYGVKVTKNSSIIGIGIARGKIFEDYNVNFSSKELKHLYIQIIIQLINKGYLINIFTNGLESDSCFAKEVKNELLEIGLDVNMQIPQTPQDLVKIISNYKAIITTRLHSCIVAYSLNIPAVGLVWNHKLSFFGKNIGAEKYYISVENFNSDYIITQLLDFMKVGYDLKQKEDFCDTIIKSIENFSINFIIPYKNSLNKQ